MEGFFSLEFVRRRVENKWIIIYINSYLYIKNKIDGVDEYSERYCIWLYGVGLYEYICR